MPGNLSYLVAPLMVASIVAVLQGVSKMMLGCGDPGGRYYAWWARVGSWGSAFLFTLLYVWYLVEVFQGCPKCCAVMVVIYVLAGSLICVRMKIDRQYTENELQRSLLQDSERRELSETLVGALPTLDKSKECSICLEEEVGLRLLPCNHTFHKECLVKWFASKADSSSPNPANPNSSCPVCRCTASAKVSPASPKISMKVSPASSPAAAAAAPADNV